jgi:hypothetical protein
MAVEMSLLPRNHKVNTVGGTDDVYRESPALKAQIEGRRTEHRLVSVWHPTTGEKLNVTQFNARDMMRHDGYLDYDPATGKREDEVEDEAAAEEVEASAQDTDYSEEIPDHMKALHGLRDQLTRLGVKVDARWGMKRLREELARFEVPEATPAAVPDVPSPASA